MRRDDSRLWQIECDYVAVLLPAPVPFLLFINVPSLLCEHCTAAPLRVRNVQFIIIFFFIPRLPSVASSLLSSWSLLTWGSYSRKRVFVLRVCTHSCVCVWPVYLLSLEVSTALLCVIQKAWVYNCIKFRLANKQLFRWLDIQGFFFFFSCTTFLKVACGR